MESHKEKILTQLFKKRLLRPPELLHEAKKKLKSISKQDVDNFYQNYSNIEFAKRIPYKKFPRKMPLRFAVSGYPHQEVYIDTMYVDMCLTPLLLLPRFFPFFRYLKRGTVPFCFMFIDGFSRKAYPRFSKTISAESATKAFESVIKEVGKPFYVAVTDRGSEFFSSFNIFCTKNGITHVYLSGPNKAMKCERLIRVCDVFYSLLIFHAAN